MLYIEELFIFNELLHETSISYLQGVLYVVNL